MLQNMSIHQLKCSSKFYNQSNLAAWKDLLTFRVQVLPRVPQALKAFHAQMHLQAYISMISPQHTQICKGYSMPYIQGNWDIWAIFRTHGCKYQCRHRPFWYKLLITPMHTIIAHLQLSPFNFANGISQYQNLELQPRMWPDQEVIMEIPTKIWVSVIVVQNMRMLQWYSVIMTQTSLGSPHGTRNMQIYPKSHEQTNKYTPA